MDPDDIYEGQFQSADFEQKTITVEIDGDFSIKAGRCLIIPTRELSLRQMNKLMDFIKNL